MAAVAAVPDPTTVPPALVSSIQNEIILKTEQAISNAIQMEQREDANRIPYARLFLTAEEQGYSSTAFSVHIRNPADQSLVYMILDNGDGSKTQKSVTLDHPGGTRDMTWDFQMFRNYSNGGDMKISLLDAKTGKVLDQIVPNYSPFQNRLTMPKDQLPFDVIEKGRTIENPITPDLQIARIDGPNVLFTVSSPFDQSYVSTTGQGGSLSNTTLSHPGGTNFISNSITFNTSNPTGNYEIQLMDRPSNGLVRDKVSVYWDMKTKTLSLKNSADGVVAKATGETPEALRYQEMIAVKTINVSDTNMNYVQGQVLLENTSKLSGNQQLLINSSRFEQEFFYKTFPQYQSKNWDAEITRRWNAAGRDATRGRVEEGFHHERIDTMNKFSKWVDGYNNYMASALQAGMKALVAIRNGTPEDANLYKELDTILGKASSYAVIGDLRALGVIIPNRGTIMGICQQMFSDECARFIQQQKDMAQLVARDKFFAEMGEQGMRQNEKGVWEKIPDIKTYAAAPTTEVSRRMQNIQRNIDLALAQYDNSDPHILALKTGIQAALKKVDAVRDVAEILSASKITDAIRSPLLTYAGDEVNAILKPFVDTNTADIGKVIATSDKKFVLPDEQIKRPESKVVRTFDLQQDSMVNIWLDSNTNGNLLLTGGPNNISYTSAKAGTSGESISSVLPKGVYTITITRTPFFTQPSGLSFVQNSATDLTDTKLHMEASKYNSSKIEGVMSMEGNPNVFPVRMSVAAFDQGGNRITKDPNTGKTIEIDPNKITFIVIHGRTDSEGSGQMSELSKSIYNFTKGIGAQVITIDWHEAANDLTKILLANKVDIGEADWTPIVAHWIASQIRSIGIDPAKINLPVHSHGSFIAFFAAKELGGVNSILALDPAADAPLVNKVNSTQIDFSQVSKTSWVIESSVIGSNARSVSADYSFYVDSGMNRLLDPIQAHGYAVSSASALIQGSVSEKRNDPFYTPFFSLSHLLDHTAPGSGSRQANLLGIKMTTDAYPSGSIEPQAWQKGFEGFISCDVYQSIDPQTGQVWYKAKPISFTVKDANQNGKEQGLNIVQPLTPTQIR